MNIIKSYLTRNPCYTKNVNRYNKDYVTFQTRGPLGLMLHSVGCPQPSANVFINLWNKESHTTSCAHAFVDANNGNVYQTLPWNYRGWHGSSGKNGSSNNTHIGVEMCEPDCIKYTSGAYFTCSNLPKAQEMVKRTYNSAVELFAKLCVDYHFDPLKQGVIVSHKEGCALGIASNHGDPEHLWSQLNLPYTMDTFRRDVKKKMSELEDDNMTQEQFNQMFTLAMNNYRKSLQDNDSGPWSDEDKKWVVDNKIFVGSGTTINGEPNYMWQDFVTREQMAALLHRLYNIK